MSLKEKIKDNLNSALKNKRESEVSVLRQLLAVIIEREKEKKYKEKESGEVKLSSEEILEAVSSEAKKRRESIDSFEKGGRKELAEKEKQELEILKRYLPEQLSEEEIEKLVKEAVEKTAAKNLKDIGKVMAELMPKVKGKADGSMVGGKVRQLLQ
jgi:uncharacterized protein